MKNILIASYDLEIGGVERSLLSMLEHFDYGNYNVDLMLYRHQGDFMPMLSNKVHLLNEIPEYATFRKSIGTLLKEKNYVIATSRILAKLQADLIGKIKRFSEPGYYQMQLMWKYAMPFLPKVKKEYDVAISYLWPHNFVAEKVNAKVKIAWIHTDFSAIETDVEADSIIWSNFNHIIAVSEMCKISFVKKYPNLKHKVKVIENINSAELIRKMSLEQIENPLLIDQKIKIVTVARLSYAKGLDIAINAMRILKKRGYKNIVWYVVGYGGEERALLELINKNNLLDSFILLGKRINPYPLIKAADIYVQPSRYEGKAVTVTEALILEKPILLTNYDTADSQIVDGYEGLICEKSDIGIADGLESLLKGEKTKELISNISKNNYNNEDEIEKLYQLF
ncbi:MULTISPECIES: glycosyltransferase [unclassified Sutcliffiella]|uniref:glycosyltransferase n=1 Tax=unclassified Sutcliffiella TaxID=2837532 RepID=UPI0030CB3E6A